MQRLFAEYFRWGGFPELFLYHIPDEHIAIQASYDITDEATRKREVNALVQLNALEPLRQALIITYDQEEIIEKDGLTINVVPAWKWV